MIMKDIKLVSEEELSEWISDWESENGSAVALWGSPEVHAQIYEAVRTGRKLKTSSSPANVRTLTKNGWTLLGDDENYDQYDAVLLKDL